MLNPSEPDWFVGLDGQRLGPLRAIDVQYLLESRNAWSALVWRSGLTSWEPAVVHFKRLGSSAAQIESASVSSPDADQRRSSAPITFEIVLGAILGLAAICIYIFLLQSDFQMFGTGAAAVYGCAWISGLACTLASAIAIWRAAKRNSATSADKIRWGVPKAISLLAVCVALAFSVMFARLTLEVSRISKAREAFSNYTLKYDPVERSIVHSGPIGAGFSARLDEILRVNAGVKYLITDSPGGLLDEALNASKVIEKHPDITVVVREQCNSACVIVLMAGSTRSAEFDSVVGLHAASSITDLPAFMAATLDRTSQTASDYIVARGMPKELVDKGNKLGSEKLLSVSAIELADDGVFSELLDQGQPISSTRAKWLWIAESVRATDDQIGFGAVASAFAESNNEKIAAAATPVFSSIKSGDKEKGRAYMRSFVEELVPDVMASADPIEARRYLAASTKSFDYLASAQSWKECAAAANGVAFDVVKSVPASNLKEEFESLARAVKSANFAGWPARPVPTWAKSEAESLIGRVVADVASVGVDVNNTSDDRGTCLFTRSLLDSVTANEPVVAVALYRYIAALP